MAVTNADVVAIITTTVATATIDAFLDTARQIVEDNLADAGLTTGTEDQIVKYLAAHLVTFEDPRTSEESADGVRFKFEGSTGLNLDASKYGQMAKMLDPTGTLANLSKQNRAGFMGRVNSL